MLTKRKLEDQDQDLLETINLQKKNIRKIFGTILVVLSGLMLYADKIYVFFGLPAIEVDWYDNYYTFLWLMGQNFSPILIILATFFGMYRLSLIIPLFAYSLQTVWIFKDMRTENSLMIYYVVALIVIVSMSFALLVFIFSLINKYKKGEWFF